MKQHPSFYVYVIVDKRNPGEGPLSVRDGDSRAMYDTRATARSYLGENVAVAEEHQRVRRAKLTIYES